MTHYQLQFRRQTERCIDVQIRAEVTSSRPIFRLPLWRPGRYTRQNFERNIADVWAKDSHGNTLSVKRIETHAWEIEAAGVTELNLGYTYFADQQDAGGTYLDANQLLVNGICLFLYEAGKESEPCSLELDLPVGYLLSGGLPAPTPTYEFTSFHQLVDSPFMASKDLQHHAFEVSGYPVHLWFVGECTPTMAKLEADIRAYSQTQLDLFGACPVEEYHYLYYLMPNRFRHGVEHPNSTVIAMGPGRDLMKKEMYDSLLAISSHEFFHTWNVKALRPADMWPYKYGTENYSELHFVTEGFTTYYGDLMLWKSGVWSLQEWIKSVNNELARHYQMGGKDYISLSEASFNSWVNGYHTEGIPNRRISFYTKGFLVSLLLDYELRKATNHAYTLDHLIRQMYLEVTAENRGYTREDLTQRLRPHLGERVGSFFAAYVDGTEDLRDAYEEMAGFYGLGYFNGESSSPSESRLGIRMHPTEANGNKVGQLYPESVMLKAGISKGDVLVALNGHELKGDLDAWMSYYQNASTLTVHFFHEGKLNQVEVTLEEAAIRKTPQLHISAFSAQNPNLTSWEQLDVPQPFAS